MIICVMTVALINYTIKSTVGQHSTRLTQTNRCGKTYPPTSPKDSALRSSKSATSKSDKERRFTQTTAENFCATMTFQHKKFHQTNTMATTVLIFIFFATTIPKETTAAITVDPVQLAVEVGQEAVFLCTRDDGGDATAIVWTYGEDLSSTIPAPTPASPGTAAIPERVTSHQGTLTVRNATHADKGRYYCWPDNTGKPNTKLEANLVVYVMPNYLTDIFAIAIVCGVFVLVLGLLTTRQWRQQQATLKREEQARRARSKVTGAWNGGGSFSEANSKTPSASQETGSGSYKMNTLGSEPKKTARDSKILSVSF